MSSGGASSCGHVGGAQFLRPDRIVGAGDEEAFERELRGGQRGFDLRDRLAAVGGLGLGLHHVDGRHRPDFDPGLIVFDQLLRELERTLRHVDGSPRVGQLPVGVADVGDGLGDGRAQRFGADVAVDLGDGDLLADGVDAEIAQQRLDVAGRERRGEGRIVVGKQVGGGQPVVVEGHGEVAAAPGHFLGHAEVVGGSVVGDALAADQLVGGRVHLAALADAARGQRAVVVAQAGNLEVGRLRRQPLDRDVEVLGQRQFHGVHQAQFADRTALPRRVRHRRGARGGLGAFEGRSGPPPRAPRIHGGRRPGSARRPEQPT